MSVPASDSPLPPSQVVPWDEVGTAASKMFRVWIDGAELEWARECWGHFAEAGLTSAESILDTTTTHLRLFELARIYREFCGYAWDENPEIRVNDLVENLEIDLVALGIIASEFLQDHLHDFGETAELHEAALVAAGSALRAEIFQCLSNAYGGVPSLYSRMFQTKPSADGDCEFEVTFANSAAFEFVTSRFQV